MFVHSKLRKYFNFNLFMPIRSTNVANQVCNTKSRTNQGDEQGYLNSIRD